MQSFYKEQQRSVERKKNLESPKIKSELEVSEGDKRKGREGKWLGLDLSQVSGQDYGAAALTLQGCIRRQAIEYRDRR